MNEPFKTWPRTCALEKIRVPRATSTASCLLYLADCQREKNYFVDPLLLPYRRVDCLVDWRRLVAKTCSSAPTRSGSKGRKTFLFHKKNDKNESVNYKARKNQLAVNCVWTTTASNLFSCRSLYLYSL